MIRTIVKPDDYTHERAPDNSLITLLARSKNASLCKGLLPPRTISNPVAHKTVEELWVISSGSGEFFCDALNAGQPFEIISGVSFTIPSNSVFQFRNTGEHPLEFVIATIPAWPGEDETVQSVIGKWKPTQNT